jgi:hypothetical protein
MNGDADKGPVSHGLAAYRATVPMTEILSDPQTKWIAEKPCLNLWYAFPLGLEGFLSDDAGILIDLMLIRNLKLAKGRW